MLLSDQISHSEALESYLAYRKYLETRLGFPPLPNELDITADDQVKLASKFEFYTSIANNRAIFNSDNGHLGLGPRTAQPDDILVILYGSQIPAVLRGHEDGASFYFVGLAYVYGIMDGEAVRKLKARDIEDTMFSIV
jgi:hypothetical protein